MNVELIKDKDRWNRFVESHDFSHAFQLYEWGEIKKVQGWQPYRIALLSESGQILAGAQVLLKQIPGAFRRIAQIPFGPVLDYGNDSIRDEFLIGVKQFAKAQRCAILLLEPYHAASETLKLEHACVSRTRMNYQHTVLLDLTRPDGVLFSDFRANYRNEIRKAQRLGVSVAEQSSKKGMERFYEMYARTYARTRRAPLPRKLFNAMARVLFPSEHARLFFSFYDGQAISAVLMLYAGATCIYMYAARAGEPELRRIPGQKCAVWHILKDAKMRGYRNFDLGGVSPSAKQGTKGHGIYLFKTGFGGQVVELPRSCEMGGSALERKVVNWLRRLRALGQQLRRASR